MTIVSPVSIAPVLASMEALFGMPVPTGGAITDIKVSILAKSFFQESAEADLLPKHLLRKEISDEFSPTLLFNKAAYLEELSRVLQSFIGLQLQVPMCSFVAAAVDMTLVVKTPTTTTTYTRKELMIAQSRHAASSGGDPVPTNFVG